MEEVRVMIEHCLRSFSCTRHMWEEERHPFEYKRLGLSIVVPDHSLVADFDAISLQSSECAFLDRINLN